MEEVLFLPIIPITINTVKTFKRIIILKFILKAILRSFNTQNHNRFIIYQLIIERQNFARSP